MYNERREVKLCGGFACRLSIEESNEWNRYITKHSGYKEFRQVAANYDHCIYSRVREDEVASLTEKIQEYENSLWEVAKGWYEELVLRRTKELRKCETCQARQDRNKKAIKAFGKLFDMCLVVDADGELDSRINGELLDMVRGVLNYE